MGTKGKTGLKQILLGSVAEKVVRRATVPVWIGRGTSPRLPEKILIPVDFSEYSRQALENGIQWAKEMKAELFIIHVADMRYLYALDPLGFDARPSVESELKKEAEEELQNWAKSISFPANLEVRIGGPVVQILDCVQENSIDLVILSTHGRSGLKHLLMGSVAEQIVRYSPCSVMTICPPAFASSKAKLFDGEKEFEDYVKSFRD